MRPSRRQVVLGMNRRNLDYVFALNPRARFPSCDDKVACKSLLEAAGLPVPRTLAVVRRRDEIQAAIQTLRQEAAMVVKPARGFGGQGVILLQRDAGAWHRPRGQRVSEDELTFHMAGILSGMFSLDHLQDAVLIEERLLEHPALGHMHGTGGVSDLRVIVSESRPAMAMLRLPSSRSGGSANLHQGGIGVGIEIATGATTFGVCRRRSVEVHPDSGRPLAGVRIPSWAAVLDVCRPVNDVFEMGYLGVDVVLDADRGPVILEVNVRPGLSIQLANRQGLRGALLERGA